MTTDLTKQAQRLLEKTHMPPARYGTAFHLSPPYQDVRELPLATFAASSDQLTEALPPQVAEHLLSFAATDPYLAWHLAYGTQLPVYHIVVAAGHQEKLVWQPQGVAQSRVVWLEVEEGASVEIYDTLLHRALSFTHLFITQGRHSNVAYWGLRAGLVFGHERLHVALVGEEATATIRHYHVGQGAEQADSAVYVVHQAPATHALVQVRTAVADRAHFLYRGKLTVEQRAAGTRGYQQGKALMLSPKAVADLLPELAIATNDVRCSHGVNTTHLDDAALFYLRSRGLSFAQARQLAIVGFFNQGDEIPPALRDELTNVIDSL